MKKYILFILVIITAALQSCTKDFDNINKNPSQFNNPDPEAIFTGIVKNTADQMQRNNMGYFWTYAHHVTVTAGTGRYGTNDRNSWTNFYVSILGNIRQLKERYKDKPEFANRVQIAEIWECYAYSYLVGIYGPVAYTQAGVTNSTKIAFDAENDVYISLLDRLKKASDAISLTGDKFAPDIVYNGDLNKWKKFANSLRLRIALRCQRNLPAESAAAIRESLVNENSLLSADTENAQLSYGAGEGNESQYYVAYKRQVVTSGVLPKMSDYLFTYFRSYKDPRLDAYFDKSVTSYSIRDTLRSRTDDTLRIVTYPIPHFGQAKSPTAVAAWGLPAYPFPGLGDDSYSDLKAKIYAADYKFMFMNYAEVCFMKAEAAYLGLGGTKTAENYYYDGLTSNFNFWGISGSLETYKNTNGIKWGTQGKGFNYYNGLVNTNIPQDNLQKIYLQQWINYFPDGAFDSWSLQRRTAHLNLPPHTNPGNQYLESLVANLPDRWEYPTDLPFLNPEGYADAVLKLGIRDFPRGLLKFAKPVVYPNWNTATAFYDTSYLQKWYGTTIQDLQTANIKYVIVGKFVL